MRKIVILIMSCMFVLTACNDSESNINLDVSEVTDEIGGLEKDTIEEITSIQETTRALSPEEDAQLEELLAQKVKYTPKVLELYEAAKYTFPDKDYFNVEIYVDEENFEIGYRYTYEEYTVEYVENNSILIGDGVDEYVIELDSVETEDGILDSLYYVHMYTKEDNGQIIILEKEDYIKLCLDEAGETVVADEKENGYICIDTETMQVLKLKDSFYDYSWMENDFTIKQYLFKSLFHGGDTKAWYEYNFDKMHWQRSYEYNDIQIVDTWEGDVCLRYDGKCVYLPWTINVNGSGFYMDFYTEDATGDGIEDVIVYYFTREETVYFIYDLAKEQDISPVYVEWEKGYYDDGYLYENIILHDEHIEAIMNAVNAAYKEIGIENTYAITLEEYKEALDSYYYLTIEWNDEGELIFNLNDLEVRVDGVYEYNGEGYDLRVDSVELVTEDGTGTIWENEAVADAGIP